MNLLETFSAKKVANIFQRMFIIRRKSDNLLKDYFSIKNKYKLDNLRNENVVDNFINNFIYIREIFAKDISKKDKILKDLNGIDIV